jgi:Ser/Thr protein kinase RdoA (MazF antagonist)
MHLGSKNLGAKKAAVQRLAECYMSNPTVRLLACRNVNTTYLADDGNNKLVIRITAKSSLGRRHVDDFQRAAQTASLVEKAGIRTRKVFLTGDTLVPYAYQISEYIEGRTAEDLSDDPEIWEQIGALARKINSIKTIGFGDQPYENPDRSWADYISEHINGILKFQRNPVNQRLSQQVRFRRDEIDRLGELLEPLKKIKPDLRLIHGDLGPHNVIVNKQRQITAVIDWDLVKSFPAEHQVGLCTFWNSLDQPIAQAKTRAFMKGYAKSFDPRVIKSLQIYEYLTQLPYHTHQAAIQHIIRAIAGLADPMPRIMDAKEELAASLA